MSQMPPTLALPVTCPTCGSERLVDFPTLVVLVALTRWNQLALYASCHEGSWDASPAELDRIRRHVGVAWIDEHRQRIADPSASAPPRRRRTPRSLAG